MRRALRAWCAVTTLALSVAGPGALVAAGDDGPSPPFPTGRPTRTVLRPTELSELPPPGLSEKEVVILVSGIGSDAPDGTFDPLVAALRLDPRYEIHRFGGDRAHPYDTLGSIDANADELIAEIRTLAKTHPKIDIVAHSMGGAVVDAAFRRGLSSSDKVATYIALASPHDGSTEARIGQPFLALGGLLGARTELRAITAGVAQDIGSRAARDLAAIHAGPPPRGVTRLDVRMATDAIVTGSDAWTPNVTSRTLLPTTLGSLEGHGGITTDPQAIALITSTVATGRPPASDWRGVALELAARTVSTLIDRHVALLYCALGLFVLGCAFGLSIYRRRRGLPVGLP
ncbi:MAG: esterase/lipase family protein [Candidatus Limnocylindria bacterium]